MAHAKGDARRLRAALDACGLALLAPKFAEHGVDDSCLPALEDELRPGPATHRQKVEHRYKTKMCKYFLAGHCPYVATGTCQFAHSRDELMAGRGSIHRAEYMNVGPAGTLPRAAFNWRDPTVLAAVGQLGGSFDDVGESAQAWPAPARFGEEAPTE